jgi:hypothetical protein
MRKAESRFDSPSERDPLVTSVTLSQEQARVDLTVLVLEAMRRVQRNPSHGPEGFIARGGAV